MFSQDMFSKDIEWSEEKFGILFLFFFLFIFKCIIKICISNFVEHDSDFIFLVIIHNES